MGFRTATEAAALILGLFLMTISHANAMYEWLPPPAMCDSVHSYTPSPYGGVPPPMPGLPNQYTMSVQANILQKSYSSEVVEYYDGPNNRAAVFLTFNGTTTQTIFNYHTMETYDIYPDGTCKARGGMADFFGFFSMDRNHRPTKSTVYQMFHMGPKQHFTYVGNTWVRGIRVNHWTSCQEWSEFGSKFQLDWYFSHEDYQTAWGTGQIPVRAVVNGSAGNTDEHRNPMFGRHKFEHIYDFTSFNVGPIKDLSVFEQPHDVVCTGRRDFKKLPNLPDNFQMDMEMNCPIMGGNMPFQHSLRYDWDHRLVETYMNIPSPQGSLMDIKKTMMEAHKTGDFSGVMPRMDRMVMRGMSQVDDHSTGLRYVTEKANDTCRVMQIPGEKDASPMDHGKSLFAIHAGQKTGESPFSYQGRSTFRNLPVDVWGMDADGMIQKVFFLADGIAPTVIKKTDDEDKPWSAGNMHGGGPSGNNYPNWKPKGEGKSTNNPYGGPRPTGYPNGRPKPTDSDRPGYPGKPDGRPKSTDSPYGRPKPTSYPNGGRPNPTGNPNNGRPGHSGKPDGRPMPTGQSPTGSSWQSNNMQNFSQKELMDMFKNHQEKMKGNTLPSLPSSGASGPNNMMSNRMAPFPVLVGMVFRNRTAISTRNMPTFFQEVMQPELINWKEKMSKKFLEDMNSQKTEGSHILDQHAMMEQMHNRVMRKAGEMDTNVFHFQPLHTDDSMFQVAHCYEPEQTSHVLLHVQTSFKTTVLGNQPAFSIAMRKGIAEAMGVSYIQISNLKPEPHIDAKKNIDATAVSFSLLGSPPVQAPRMKPPSISEAKRKLIRAIKNGITFKVNYPTHTKSFLVDKNQYVIDRAVFQTSVSDSALNQNQKSSDDSDKYSAGAVAGIALATLLIGFVLAAAVIIILRKRTHPEEPVIPYKITKE